MFYERLSRYNINYAWGDIMFLLMREQKNVRDPSLMFEFDDEEEQKRRAIVCVPYCGSLVLNYLEEDVGEFDFVSFYNELVKKKWMSRWWRGLRTGFPFPPSIQQLKAELLSSGIQDERVLVVTQKHFYRPFVLVLLRDNLDEFDYVYKEDIEYEFCTLYDALEFLGKYNNLSIYSHETKMLLMTE